MDASARNAAGQQVEPATSDETFDSPAKKQHRQQQAAEALAAMRALQGKIQIGRKLTREEMNEGRRLG
uniref:Uncharacterized protein n=1 Tax=Candidatus Kentrum sp. DK TaxID=2126562 RepID=A0A450SJJ6_9GAMM|nr:MAG: hypothetical protein BECKDK2373B_GA0170837_104310 [Candidatus Kentron sp. DK]